MDEEPTGVDLIAQIIASMDGGYNGLNLRYQISVSRTGDNTLDYTLTDASTDPVTVETHTITIT
jgi:hypothetical protein